MNIINSNNNNNTSTILNSSKKNQNNMSNASSSQQKMKQLDIKSLENKLNLRNEKMETLVNEVKKQKKQINKMEYNYNLSNQKYESDIKRLKEKAQLKIKQLQATFSQEITMLKNARINANNQNKLHEDKLSSSNNNTSTTLRFLENNLSATNSKLLTSNATNTKLRNEIAYLNQQIEKVNFKLINQTTEKNRLESKMFAMQRSLKTTQMKAIDYEGKAQQLEAQHIELKSINRALRKELEIAEISHSNTKSELCIIKDNYLLVKNKSNNKKKNHGSSDSKSKTSNGISSLYNHNDDDDDELLPLVTPFNDGGMQQQQQQKQQSFVKASPKKELEKLLRTEKLMAAAVQVSRADDVIVDYILNVVTNELEDLQKSSNNKRSKLDDSIKEALFSLVPSIQEQYQQKSNNSKGMKQLDNKLKKILVNWAEIFVVEEQEAKMQERNAMRIAAAAASKKQVAKSKSPPPGFEDVSNSNSKNNNNTNILTTTDTENEYIEILKSLFPEISNLKQLLLLHGGDVNLTAESIFDELNAEEERFKIWFINDNHEDGPGNDENEMDRKKRERRMRQQILEQYFMRLEQTRKCNPDFIGKYVANNFDNSKIRYRNDRVVSTKGERFIRVQKETKEQIQATSVSLAWVKRKRKGGQQKANLK